MLFPFEVVKRSSKGGVQHVHEFVVSRVWDSGLSLPKYRASSWGVGDADFAAVGALSLFGVWVGEGDLSRSARAVVSELADWSQADHGGLADPASRVSGVRFGTAGRGGFRGASAATHEGVCAVCLGTFAADDHRERGQTLADQLGCDQGDSTAGLGEAVWQTQAEAFALAGHR